MTVDIVLGVVMVLSVVVGVLRGALLEVLSLLAFGAALVWCQPLGQVLVPGMATLLPNVSALGVHAAATVLAGLMILLVGTAVTALVVRLAKRKGGKSFSAPNRVVGGSLGGIRAVLIWLVAACFVPPADGDGDSALGRQMRESALLAAANRANPLLHVPAVRDARTLQALLRDRDQQIAFFALPETRTFLAQPSVTAAVEEGHLESAVARADLATLVRSPPVQAALLEAGVLRSLRTALAAHHQRR